MTQKTPTSSARLAIALVGAALMALAFLRGNYLLGVGYGITYALVVAAIVWLFTKSFTRTRTVSLARLICLVVFAVSVGYALAFPATINSDVRHFIDKQAADRRVRAELSHVFESDVAFANLSIATTHLKVVNVTISGALFARDDLQRLRKRIAGECPAVKLCPLQWDIRFRDTNDRVDGRDHELFPSADDEAEQSVAPSRGPRGF